MDGSALAGPAVTLRPTLQERAYQLAHECPNVGSIGQQLMREGYDNVQAQLAAPSLRLALKRLCRLAAKTRSAEQAAVEPVEDETAG
jgi:hypothetical protein